MHDGSSFTALGPEWCLVFISLLMSLYSIDMGKSSLCKGKTDAQKSSLPNFNNL